MDAKIKNTSNTDVSIDKDIFLLSLIRELTGSLEDIVGLNEAAGFISIVGQNIGCWMNEEYRRVLKTDLLSSEQVSDVLIDLKKRIDGDFYLISEDKDKIILGNRRCPFGNKVLDRPSMCMMTSNVFGSIAANNLGYAKVELQETIAKGNTGCRVVVYIKRTDESKTAEGREYFGND